MSDDSEDDHEEDFYWREVEMKVATSVDLNSNTGVRGAIVGGIVRPSASDSTVPTSTALHATDNTAQFPVAVSKSNGSLVQPTNIITIGGDGEDFKISSSVSPSAAATTLLTLSSSNTTLLSHPVKIMAGGSGAPARHLNLGIVPRKLGYPIHQGGLTPTRAPVTSQYVQVSPPPTLSHMDMARPPHEGNLFSPYLINIITVDTILWPVSLYGIR